MRLLLHTLLAFLEALSSLFTALYKAEVVYAIGLHDEEVLSTYAKSCSKETVDLGEAFFFFP
jgi:hypothetical protein